MTPRAPRSAAKVRTRVPLVAALAAVLALLAAPVAQAGPVLDRTVACLKRQPVCVDPAAQDVLSPADARELAQRIEREQPRAVYVAVVPDSAAQETGGTPEGFMTALERRVGARATYAGIVGQHFRATSSVRPVGGAAGEAFQAHRSEGPRAVLDDFVDRVAQTGGGSTSGRGDSGGDSGGSTLVPLVILGVVLLLLFAMFGASHRRRRRREREQLEEVKRVARDDLVALGEDIRSLDLDVEMPNADATAKEDYGRAVELYQRAEEAFDSARRPEDLAPVTSAVEEGRYAIASARARLEGREPPERLPPCFFDPRHGPSVRDVEWAPPGGAPRPVPACAADAQRLESGLEPAAREIEYAGQRMPYWNAPAYYGPWAGGFFGGFGMPFLGGLFLGEALGGGFGGDTYVDNDYYGDQGGGDFGGGDFGGGDFGGGDFGGGDFGGGDFGGGDF